MATLPTPDSILTPALFRAYLRLPAHARAASCRHELTELLATKPRSLDGAKRVCAACGSEVRS